MNRVYYVGLLKYKNGVVFFQNHIVNDRQRFSWRRGNGGFFESTTETKEWARRTPNVLTFHLELIYDKSGDS